MCEYFIFFQCAENRFRGRVTNVRIPDNQQKICRVVHPRSVPGVLLGGINMNNLLQQPGAGLSKKWGLAPWVTTKLFDFKWHISNLLFINTNLSTAQFNETFAIFLQ